MRRKEIIAVGGKGVMMDGCYSGFKLTLHKRKKGIRFFIEFKEVFYTLILRPYSFHNQLH